jgi:hypothetical protein
MSEFTGSENRSCVRPKIHLLIFALFYWVLSLSAAVKNGWHPACNRDDSAGWKFPPD